MSDLKILSDASLDLLELISVRLLEHKKVDLQDVCLYCQLALSIGVSVKPCVVVVILSCFEFFDLMK